MLRMQVIQRHDQIRHNTAADLAGQNAMKGADAIEIQKE